MKLTKTILLIGILLVCVCTNWLYAGQVALSWKLPTLNCDGTPLTDLAGCKIYYGLSSRNYTYVVDLPGPVTNCVISNLADNVVFYFVGTCYNSVGNESDFSDEVCRPRKLDKPSNIRIIK